MYFFLKAGDPKEGKMVKATDVFNRDVLSLIMFLVLNELLEQSGPQKKT